MKHLTSQALDHLLQMPIHLSIPAIGCLAEDEFENHFIAHPGIDFADTPVCAYGFPENSYTAFNTYPCAEPCSELELCVSKRPCALGICSLPSRYVALSALKTGE